MPRPVALLDVDHTLSFHSDPEKPPELNQSLIDSLKKKGIKDVYLFTDMKYSKSDVQDRLQLIQHLKDEGFTVHGVVTPADLVWQAQPADQAIDFYNRVMGANPEYRGKCAGVEFEAYIDSIDPVALPFLQDVKKYSSEGKTPGASFDEAVASYEKIASIEGQAPLPDHISERSFVAKMLADRYAINEGYSHTKAFMLDLFLRNKPEWVSSVVIADDNEKVIQSVQRYKDREQPAVPITAIHVTEQHLSPQFYKAVLDEHLSQDSLADKKSSLPKSIGKSIKNSFTAVSDFLKDNFSSMVASITSASVGKSIKNSFTAASDFLKDNFSSMAASITRESAKENKAIMVQISGWVSQYNGAADRLKLYAGGVNVDRYSNPENIKKDIELMKKAAKELQGLQIPNEEKIHKIAQKDNILAAHYQSYMAIKKGDYEPRDQDLFQDVERKMKRSEPAPASPESKPDYRRSVRVTGVSSLVQMSSVSAEVIDSQKTMKAWVNAERPATVTNTDEKQEENAARASSRIR